MQKITPLKMMSINTPERPTKKRIQRTGSVSSAGDSITSDKRIIRRQTIDNLPSQLKSKLLIRNS